MFSFYLTQYSGKFLGPIARVLGYIMSAIYNFLAHFGIENAAVSIIIFTFSINLLMLPFTIKQQKFSKMQSKMQPEMQKIQEKYKGKKDNASMYAQQEEMKALYEKYGTSASSGCLPMIITMIVFFALYRVIYAIPAYVPQIKEIYETIANLTTGNTDALQYLLDNGKNLNVSTITWNSANIDMFKQNSDYIIDVFTKFGRENWDAFAQFFTGEQLAIVTRNADKIMHVNGIFGNLNLAETPLTKPWPGLIIPILSVILQYVQTHFMMSNQQIDPSNPSAATMKSMNTVMPLMSGFFCLMFPIGNGIYLLSSSAFRIIQQIFVNKYMDQIDMDAEIAKNMEKAQKKREKLHLEASDGSIKNVANMRTGSSVNDIAKMNTNKKDVKQDKDASYEKGSISSIAHMMDKSKD